MFRNRIFRLPALLGSLLLVLLLGASSRAQTGAAQTSADTPAASATIVGKVLDSSKAAIVGARILARPDGKGSGLSVDTDQNGVFSLTLVPGSYRLTVTASGFKETSQTVSLLPNVSLAREFTLQVSGSKETVTVTEPSDYQVEVVSSATKTSTPLRDVPQSVTVITQELVRDQMMLSMGDVARYVPGVISHQGENNRDQLVIRGNSTSADFFLNGVRDDVQYYRDFYNLEQVEALKGPNAMVFGRGGGGGVINRVTKQASSTPLREITAMGGSFNNARFTADFNQPLGDKVAFRFNGMYENSDSFRDHVNLDRYGVNPTFTILPDSKTSITVGYEHFLDRRVADRGIPSFQGRPVDVDISTYFGNPDDSSVHANVNLGSVTFNRQAGLLTIRNSTLFGGYDRNYQNYVPGAVTADKSKVSLSAYNSATSRLNIFNQTDVTYVLYTGRIRHVLLGGAEFGRQSTDNFRNTGYFNNTATSILAPLENPVISTPVTFRQSLTDADNHVGTTVAAGYIQDQVEFTPWLQMIAGLRFDRFDLEYRNNRNGDNLGRIDDLPSPRLGIVFKPASVVSVYGSYNVSHLPSSGDQFSSLTTITQQVKPEKFTNYEVGLKWDINRRLSLTTAGYRLNRTNTRSTDPNDPTRIVQTGSQRTNGFEIGLTGTVTRKWNVVTGYAWQDASITSATTAAPRGAQVAMVPHHTFSVWNNYQFVPRFGAGFGVVSRSDMFAAIDDKVVLPGYVEANAGLYFLLTEKIRLQANVKNLLNAKYYVNADNNNNISPGSPAAVRIALIARF